VAPPAPGCGCAGWPPGPRPRRGGRPRPCPCPSPSPSPAPGGPAPPAPCRRAPGWFAGVGEGWGQRQATPDAWVSPRRHLGLSLVIWVPPGHQVPPCHHQALEMWLQGGINRRFLKTWVFMGTSKGVIDRMPGSPWVPGRPPQTSTSPPELLDLPWPPETIKRLRCGSKVGSTGGSSTLGSP